jgi:hypothetical protein
MRRPQLDAGRWQPVWVRRDVRPEWQVPGWAVVTDCPCAFLPFASPLDGMADRCRAFLLSPSFFQAWYRENLQISIPITIVVGIFVLLILSCLLKSVRRCCCGRGRSKSTAIPPGVPGQRIPSWTDLPNSRNNNSGNGENRDSGESRGDSSQPLIRQTFRQSQSYNSVPPRRAANPAFSLNNNGNGNGNGNGNRRPSDDSALVYNPFEPARISPAPVLPAALRPGGGSGSGDYGRSLPALPAQPEPAYPLPPAVSRQSTWSNAGVAGVGSTAARPRGRGRGSGSGSGLGAGYGYGFSHTNSDWVDERLYNGPRS